MGVARGDGGLALGAGTALAQDRPEGSKPDPTCGPEARGRDDDGELTPEEALRMLAAGDLRQLPTVAQRFGITNLGPPPF